MAYIDQQVDNYLKSERQWTRQCRIDHARLRLSKAKTTQYVDFWQRVLNKLGAAYAKEASH